MFRVTLLLGLLGLPLVSQASTPPTTTATAPVDHAIDHWILANGVRVYFIQAPELPMVDMRLVFNAGSARDQGRAGLARLTSALLTQGSSRRNADQIAEQFDRVGAQVGTGSARDMAWVSLRSLNSSDALSTAVSTLAQSLTKPTFPIKAFSRERQRLLLAVRQQQQYPSAVAMQTFYQELYGNHPYASPPGGTLDSLTSLTVSQVQNFHKRYYVGQNAVLAIVGDLTPDTARLWAERFAGGLLAGQAAEPLPDPSPLPGNRDIHVDFDSQQSHILIGHLGIKRNDRHYFDALMLNHILGGSGLVSQLAQAIRQQQGLAYSVSSRWTPMAQAGPFIISMQTKAANQSRAIAAIGQVLKKYLEHGPDAKQWQDGLLNLTGRFPMQVDSNRKKVSYLAMIGFYQLPLDYLTTYRQQLKSTNRQQALQWWQQYLLPMPWLTVTVGPANHGP